MDKHIGFDIDSNTAFDRRDTKGSHARGGNQAMDERAAKRSSPQT
jgi:hypothetical protein